MTDRLEANRRENIAYLFARDRAAFALYKYDNPESVADSWETVGLPIVLEYRERAGVVLSAYLDEPRG